MKHFVHKLLQDDDKIDTHPPTFSNDTGYFDSYSHHGIHHDMLSVGWYNFMLHEISL